MSLSTSSIVGAEGGAKIVADIGLRTMIEVWPSLNEDVKASILEMIQQS